MKIAWFTPFSEKSAIGKYSKLATDALCRYASVDIFVFEKDNLLKTNLKIINYSINDKLIAKLGEYDIIVYNMGDYSPYHEKIYEVLQIKKGIIIIHDASLLGFYYGYFCDSKKDGDAFATLYTQIYCELADNAINRYTSNDSTKYGFMEHITSFCSGVIVHSDFHAEIIRRIYNGPLLRIYFPFTQEYMTVKESSNDSMKETSKINMLTVGNINKNKRVYEVVQTIGKSELLKKSLIYTVIGSKADSEYIKRIEELIEQYNLSDVVKLIGYMDDATLAAYYRDADVICNLRNPAIEGASWSLVEQMSLGKPVIVSDNGFYSEIPDDCVLKISIDNEDKDLDRILTSIVKDSELLKHKGHSAEKLVNQHFNQQQYAENFMNFTSDIFNMKPIESLMNRISFVMNEFNISKDMKIVETVSEQIEIMFSK